MKVGLWKISDLIISQWHGTKSGLSQFGGSFCYFTPRLFAALASPEPRVPRSPPRAAPPLPAGAPLPAPPVLDAGAGVENLGVAFEDVGGFSTKDVSVVLRDISYRIATTSVVLT